MCPASSSESSVFTPPPITALPVRGLDKAFPVRRVYCVGRNYADHAREMGHDPNRSTPFFFQKNPDNLIVEQPFPYPPLSSDVHHEVELVIALKDGGQNIPAEAAMEKIYGYGVAIDFTRRDLQAKAKDKGHPWAAAKAFEFSAPISPLVQATEIVVPDQAQIWLSVNDTIRQNGNTNQMIWSIPEIIAELSKQFVLAPGDIILTGTPAGVGPIVAGDTIRCGVDGVAEITVPVQ